jgi:DNA N-6-adenine-methyltransferase (Dam)
VAPIQKPGRSKQDYATPQVFLEAVKRRLGIGGFTFDLAADTTNAVAPRWWSEQDNSLSKTMIDWRHVCGDGWAWLNPSFGHIEPWAKLCMETGTFGGKIALLVPAGVGSNWYRDYVDGHAHVLALNGRLSFDGIAPYPKDCLLCLYGLGVRGGFEVWDWRAK